MNILHVRRLGFCNDVALLRAAFWTSLVVIFSSWTCSWTGVIWPLWSGKCPWALIVTLSGRASTVCDVTTWDVVLIPRLSNTKTWQNWRGSEIILYDSQHGVWLQIMLRSYVRVRTARLPIQEIAEDGKPVTIWFTCPSPWGYDAEPLQAHSTRG
jgi:hypothetical protein